jgi:hypothetical protein
MWCCIIWKKFTDISEERSVSLSMFSVETGNSLTAAVNCYWIAWHHTPEGGGILMDTAVRT